MSEYQNILSGYVNKRRNGDGHYLVITNVSDEDITIKAGDKVYLNRTPAEILKKHPKVPHYSKSEKIEHEEMMSDEEVESINNTIPF